MSLIFKTCKNNPSHTFTITDEDQVFYEKISPIFHVKKYFIPPPMLCPDCRLQQRLTFRNERKLYNRKSDLTGKQIISIYPPDKPGKVYEQEEWFSDKLDAKEYGRSFDFNRPFFEQFQELLRDVPVMALLNDLDNQNASYCNYVATSKDCYLLYASMRSHGCLYSAYLWDRQSIVDCIGVKHSELGYESVDCVKIYNCAFCQDCINSHDLLFCYDCLGCNDCICCTNLRRKQFCIFNEQFSEQEYKKRKKELQWNHSILTLLRKKFEKIKEQAIRKYAILDKCEQCQGDRLYESKNAYDCYYCSELEDCKYTNNVVHNKDCYDLHNCENSELCYFCSSGNTNYMTTLYEACCNCKYVLYSSSCFNCEYLFGCAGLKRNSYCILNKQYSKKEYEELVPKIIEHMKKTGEWGEFFPINLSPFGYNETVAYEYYPLLKDKAIKLGAIWKEDDVINRYEGPKVNIPENIKDVKDDIIQKILTCDSCTKNYKLISQEVKFYKTIGLPIPRNCPDCRHRARLALRNPRKLWDRKCMKCGVDIKTSYEPKRKEIIYCEECYNQAIY